MIFTEEDPTWTSKQNTQFKTCFQFSLKKKKSLDLIVTFHEDLRKFILDCTVSPIDFSFSYYNSQGLNFQD